MPQAIGRTPPQPWAPESGTPAPQESPGRRLRRLLASQQLVRVLEAHNGLCGLIAEHAQVEVDGQLREFDGLWASSLCDSVSRGKPDIEVVDLTARLATVQDLMETTSKPIVFDADTGGRADQFAFRARTLARLGVAAVVIEDKAGAKRNSLLAPPAACHELESIAGFCDKLNAGRAAIPAGELLLVARIESLIAGAGLRDALERAQAYCQEGAEAVMIHSRSASGLDVQRFATQFRSDFPQVPLVVAPTTYGHLSDEELVGWGVNMVVHANQMLRSAYRAMLLAAQSILREGRGDGADAHCAPVAEILGLVPGTT